MNLEWASIRTAKQERQFYKRKELRLKRLIPHLFPFYSGRRKGFIPFIFDSIRLIPLCLLVILSACGSLPDLFQFNYQQAISQREEAPRATAQVTASPVVEVTLAAFGTEQAQAPSQPVGITPPIQTTATQALPPPAEYTSDLLFISDGKLMRWDHVTDFKTPLVEGVWEYSASQDTRRIVLLRDTKITANGVALYNLDLLDMETKQVTSLLKGIPRINRLTISPNGLWVAFQEQNEASPTIYVLNIRHPDQRQQLGICHEPVGEFCNEIGWSPDNYALFWEDAQGIWISKLGKGQPKLLTGHNIEVSDPRGEMSQVAVAFNDVNWSPGGRYLLTQVITEAQVCWFAVLDSYQSRWTEVPGTFDNICPTSASVNWTDDGKLLVANISQQTAYPNLTLSQWQVIPTRTGLFALEREMEFSNLQIDLTGSSPAGETELITLWPGKILDKFIGFGIGTANPANEMALYLIDLEQEQLKVIIRRPDQADLALWAPDGSGVLLLGASKKVVYVPFQDVLIDLAESHGIFGDRFVWTPALPRS